MAFVFAAENQFHPMVGIVVGAGITRVLNGTILLCLGGLLLALVASPFVRGSAAGPSIRLCRVNLHTPSLAGLDVLILRSYLAVKILLLFVRPVAAPVKRQNASG